MNFFRQCWTIAFPLLGVTFASTLLFCLGHRIAATLVADLGTLFVMLGNVVYIVGWHSRTRWRGAPAAERLRRLLTYRR